MDVLSEVQYLYRDVAFHFIVSSSEITSTFCALLTALPTLTTLVLNMISYLHLSNSAASQLSQTCFSACFCTPTVRSLETLNKRDVIYKSTN